MIKHTSKTMVVMENSFYVRVLAWYIKFEKRKALKK